MGLCPICLLESDLPPARLGDSLVLLEELGRGGMGAVYRAHDERLDRDVAVKFLPEALAGAAPDPRMDVYALGVVLYEVVTGRLPGGEVELHRESRLWLGLTLALCPPVVELGRYLLAWRP